MKIKELFAINQNQLSTNISIVGRGFSPFGNEEIFTLSGRKEVAIQKLKELYGLDRNYGAYDWSIAQN